MSFNVKFSNQAKRFFKSLENDIQERIREKFKEVAKEPFRFLEHYEGDYHKLRIGDFRALIDVDSERKIMWIRVFDKRGRICK